MVGEYTYDAYGNCIITKDQDNIASKNPFRYRGYFFDVETNLYYLNSRYYDSKTGRFISPDSIEYLDPESINGLNLYCYCYNNPSFYSNPSGNLPQWAEWLIGGVVIVGLEIATIFTGGWIGVVLGAAFYSAVRALVGGIIGGITGGWEVF